MLTLDYMDPWYTKGPLLHKGVGLLIFSLLIVRTLWTFFNKSPEFVSMPDWERLAAWLTHKTFYVLLFCVTISGYMISTADGRGVEFLNLFDVPALIEPYEMQEEVAGRLHFILAVSTIAFVGLHVAATLKHHFIEKDATLLRMLGRG